MTIVQPIRSNMPPQSCTSGGWWWDGCGWQPPPCPPPGDCSCQAPPTCYSAIAKADACWDQSQALYDLVTKVVEDIFAKNPGIIPPPPPTAGSGPILGVTDGSNAAPGEVGEFIQTTTNISYAAYPNVTNGTISAVVLQPGDWDMWASISFSGSVGAVGFQLSPQPAGTSNAMLAQLLSGGAPGTQAEQACLIGQTAKGNFSVPTLLPFIWEVAQSTDSGLPAGTGVFWFEARRRR